MPRRRTTPAWGYRRGTRRSSTGSPVPQAPGVAEGVEGLVPIKGSVKELVDQAIGGIRSGMYHVGAATIPGLWEKAQFIQITQASLTESHPHSILITNPGENYS